MFSVAGVAFAACLVDVPALGPPEGAGACAPGLADCDGGGACATNLSSDGESCGECGRSCNGEACLDGVCEPQSIAQLIDFPHSVTLVDGVVYYTLRTTDAEHGEVRRLSAGGGKLATLVTRAPHPAGLAVHGDWLYWASGASGALHRVRIDADAAVPADAPEPGVLEEVFPGIGSRPAAGEANVVVDGNRVYWTFERGGMVWATDGSDDPAEIELASGQDAPAYLAVLDDHVYWTGAFAGLRRTEKGPAGSAVETIVGPPGTEIERGSGVVAHGGHVYWRATSASGEGRLLRFDPGEPGGAHEVAIEAGGAGALASDGDFLFWVTPAEGDIWRARPDGSARLRLAREERTPTGIAASSDDGRLVWTTFAVSPYGGVFIVPK